MDQRLALEIMLSGRSVILTGAPGTGKTYVLNQFINLAKKEGKYVSVTATTGLAATHIGGTTIHSWSGIGINNELSKGFIEHLSKSRRDIIEKTNVLVIDEISMLHDFRLDMIDEVCRMVRKRLDEPFGGIQVVMSGDFFQLPPVNRGDERIGGFVVNATVWKELNPVVCYLEQQYRQNDKTLMEILHAIRKGDVRHHHAEALLSRTEVYADDIEQLTELHTVNVDVDTINNAKLRNIVADEISYEQTTTGAQRYVDALRRSVLAPKQLRLKQGALVMAVKNSPDRKYVNGSVGEVVSFQPQTNFPIVAFRNGKEMVILPETWEQRDGDIRRATITQLPLRLAWAITIHKSQGMTLDAARIDLRKAFVEGMGYVALSRVKNMDNLYLTGINQMALRVSQEAQRIDTVFREQAVNVLKEFQHLRASATKRTQVPTKVSSKQSNWIEKIAKMRETYPNAYRPWTHQHDELLKQSFIHGHTVKQLSKELGRHEGSIQIRLQKLFGDDIVEYNKKI